MGKEKPDYSFLLPDGDFEQDYQNIIKPRLEACMTEAYIAAKDTKGWVTGLYARFYHNEEGCHSDQVICVCHGFTEYADKCCEIIYNFLMMGYNVAIVEHRGHGHSGRALDNPTKVHIDTYDTYVTDYHAFVEKVKEVFPEKELLLFGHSMGGCISTLYLEAYPDDFKAAVLSSPMHEINAGGIPSPLCYAFGRFMCLIGRGETYLGSQDQDFDGSEKFEESCCTDYGRWKLFMDMRWTDPMLQTGAGSIKWMTESLAAVRKLHRQIGQIQTPILLCQAGRDHMVLPGGQNRFVRKCKTAQIKRFPRAKHETFNCDEASRKTFWKAVGSFYGGI